MKKEKLKYSIVKKMPTFIDLTQWNPQVSIWDYWYKNIWISHYRPKQIEGIIFETNFRAFGILELVKDDLQAGVPYNEILRKIEELENA